MPNSEKNKRPGRHAPQPAPAIQADTDLYGDEADAPHRARRQKRSAARKAPAKTKGVKRRQPHFNPLQLVRDFLQGNDTAHTQAHLFEYISRGDESMRPSGFYVLGRRIHIWPVITAMLLILLVSYVLMSNNNITVDARSVTSVGLSGDLEGYRLLVISDLNGRRFGDGQSSLLRSISSVSYDAVFFLGDMVGKGGDPEPFYELLEGLPSSRPKYFICGDSDPGPFVDEPRQITGTLSQIVLADWILGAIERGATYVDEPTALKVGGSTMWIYPSTQLNLEANTLVTTWKAQMEQEQDGVLSGLEADYNTLPVTSYRYRNSQNLYAALNSMATDDFYLCLAHEVPGDKTLSVAAMLREDDGRYLPAPELMLCGHYCGGVWRLPGLGAFYIPDNMSARNGWLPEQDRVSGLYPYGETSIYTSRGLSTNASVPLMPFRLFNNPQISLLTLTATLPENMLDAQ